MPAQFVEWADEHRELLDRVVWVLARNGTWPLLTDLTRDFLRLGKATPTVSWKPSTVTLSPSRNELLGPLLLRPTVGVGMPLRDAQGIVRQNTRGRERPCGRRENARGSSFSLETSRSGALVRTRVDRARSRIIHCSLVTDERSKDGRGGPTALSTLTS